MGVVTAAQDTLQKLPVQYHEQGNRVISLILKNFAT